MFKICGINPGEFILDGKPLAEKGAAVKETVVINSVARKVDVDKEILPPNKLNYFKAKKEHIVDQQRIFGFYGFSESRNVVFGFFRSD